jgi:glycine cleavage system H protein
MTIPENLRYTKDHEWAQQSGPQTVRVGITDHAQSSLGDVVYLELPPVGKVLKKGETFGVVESIKAVSDLYAPLPGKVTAINAQLLDDPAQLNRDPYGIAWLIEIEPAPEATGQLDQLMDSKSYSSHVQSASRA